VELWLVQIALKNLTNVGSRRSPRPRGGLPSLCWLAHVSQGVCKDGVISYICFY
jgi:hypothetical protein